MLEEGLVGGLCDWRTLPPGLAPDNSSSSVGCFPLTLGLRAAPSPAT